jgi:hypothetical protein
MGVHLWDFLPASFNDVPSREVELHCFIRFNAVSVRPEGPAPLQHELTHQHVRKPISRKDLAHFRKDWKIHIFTLPYAGQRLCFARKWNPLNHRRKHEENRSQDRCYHIAVISSRYIFRSGRQHTKADVLAQSLFHAIELSAVGGWFTLATHRYAHS